MTMAGRSDLKPGKGYHFATGAYVEYIGNVEANDKDALIATLNEKAAQIIAQTPADMPVFKKMCTYEEADRELAKAGGIPSYIAAGSSLRVLKLTADDAGCPCGGTHVEHVSDIQKLIVTKILKKGKNVRVSYQLESSTEQNQSKQSAPVKTAPAKSAPAKSAPAKNESAKKAADPIVEMQEEMYAKLITIRNDFHQALVTAISEVEAASA